MDLNLFINKGFSISQFFPRSFILTDLPEVMPLIEANLEFNRVYYKEKSLTSSYMENIFSNYKCESYIWGDSIPNNSLISKDIIDLIIASDIVYFPEVYDDLIATIRHFFLQNEHPPVMILAHRHRNPDDYKFFGKLRQVSFISIHQLELNHLTYDACSSDVKLFQITSSRN